MAGAHIVVHGFLGRAPEVKTTNSGHEIGEFSVAVSHWKGQGKDETTTWFKCTVWGKPSESLNKDWQKGDYVIASGEFENREYTDKEGAKRVSAEVNVKQFTNVTKIARAKGSGGGGGSSHSSPAEGSGWSGGGGGGAQRSRGAAAAGPPPSEEPDDLPF